VDSPLCRRNAELKACHILQEKQRLEREITIQTSTATLPTVNEFRYLGRILTANNSDWPAIQKNLVKARSKWALISHPLTKTGVSPRYVSYFYKAIVQLVLLYGSESWVLTTPMLNVLNGFQHRIARRISGLMATREDDKTWHYPPIKRALEIAGLYSISEYISKRHTTLASYVATHPILQICQEQAEEKAPYSQSKMFPWWSQPHVTPPLEDYTPQPRLPHRLPQHSAPPTQDTSIEYLPHKDTVQAPRKCHRSALPHLS
jgi:hypothetical protein